MHNIRTKVGSIWRSIFPKIGEIVDLGVYAKKWCLPAFDPLDHTHELPNILNISGTDFKIDEQIARLDRWQSSEYQELFRVLRQDQRINCGETENIIDNGYYPTPDAECYAAMILDYAPEQIIEVGSGYSTRIARRAIDFAKLPTKITVIDPEPRADISQDAHKIIRAPIESLPKEAFHLTENTILFIDSSHICRSRGDVPFLFCEILPNAPKNLIAHIHDVYIPYEYPAKYYRWLWNEQYLLCCLLSDSIKYEILLTTYLMTRRHLNYMQKAISPCVSAGRNSGGCFWIRSLK